MNGMKWALVTGASSGIGFAYAENLAKRGYNILLVSNQEKQGEEKANLIANQFRIETEHLCIDLAQPNAAKQVFDFCENKHLSIEVLINNAGMFFWQSLTKIAENKVQNMIHLHITTPTLLCYYFSKKMQQQKKGYILNATSICAWMPFPTLSMYSNSKTYLKNFSYSLHYELKNDGVYVCHVAPGAVDTDLYGLPTKWRKILLKCHIMQTPNQIAKAGIKGLFAGKKRIIPGFINWFIIGLVKICPLWLINFIKNRFFREK